MSGLSHGAAELLARQMRDIAREEAARAAGSAREASRAVVSRVDEDGVTWVRLEGSATDTPCAGSTAEALPGQSVSVTVRGGRATVTGNYSAPAAGGQTARDALERAYTADRAAGHASAAARSAQASARAAGEAADSASAQASRAQSSADQAALDAATASEMSQRAMASAGEAADGARDAEAQARQANASATGALASLAEVQGVLGTATWIAEHGTRVASADEQVSPSKAYYTRSGSGTESDPWVWSPVAPGGGESPAGEGWFELVVDEAVSRYVATHLALTDDGLRVVAGEGGYSLVASPDAIRVYDGQRRLVGMFGESMQLGALSGTHLEASGDRLSFVSAGGDEVAYIAVDASGASVFYMNRAVVVDELRFSDWAWRRRDNGNLALKWIGG